MSNLGSTAVENAPDMFAGRLSGLDYVTSDEKLQLDTSIAEKVLPFARAGSLLTELVIYGNWRQDHKYSQLRDGVNQQQFAIPKIRTMRQAAADSEMDIDRYSPRIVNKRALLARVIGLDELPQWELVGSGDMSLVGPRPLLKESKERFSVLAEAGGVASEEVDEWREFLNTARPGLYGKSQAMRHRRNFKEYTPDSSAKVVRADLAYKQNASKATDLKTIGFASAVTLLEGLKSVR